MLNFFNPPADISRAAQVNAAGRVATMTGANLNLRSAPSLNSQVIGSLPQGSAVIILGDENGFYRVSAGGQTGFVSQEFIMLPANATGVVTTATGANLNLRAAPNASAPILGVIPNGTSVPISGEQNGFYLVTFNGRQGFASFGFIAV